MNCSVFIAVATFNLPFIVSCLIQRPRVKQAALSVRKPHDHVIFFLLSLSSDRSRWKSKEEGMDSLWRDFFSDLERRGGISVEEERSQRADEEQGYLKHSRAPKASAVNLHDSPGREPQACPAGQNPDAGERQRTQQHRHTPPPQKIISKKGHNLNFPCK